MDITDSVIDKIQIKSFYENQPTKLQLTMLLDDKINFEQGDSIHLQTDENKIFFGYIFTKKNNRQPKNKHNGL